MSITFNFTKTTQYKNICAVEGCGKPCKGKYCTKHYNQISRYGYIKNRTAFDKNEIIENEKYAEIILYNKDNIEKARAKIDIEDVDKIRSYKWNFSNYVYTNINKKRISLHRIITDTINEPDKYNNLIDHINGDVLDNRKFNLRICSPSENAYNRHNKVKGYTSYKSGNKIYYKAYIYKDNKCINLGTFVNEGDAIKARKEAEIKYGIYKFNN